LGSNYSLNLRYLNGSPIGRTTVTRRWIAEHLRMGYETRVSQAVGWVESGPTREVLGMREKLTENTI
jgi:hypothetical protein